MRSVARAITIRSAAAGDSSSLARLSGVLGYPVPDHVMAARIERLLHSTDDTIFVATLLSGDIVGWLHGSEHDLLESGRHCEILGLVVDPEHRGKGVGHSLLAAVERWATGRGLDEVAVRSNVVRIESHPFYERSGYIRVKTQHAYRKTLSH
jgi:GNAT superfamily N-acetyltransferase